MKIRLGTRGSKLALSQSEWVAERLRRAGHDVETLIIETRGDQLRDRAFAAIGQPGVFVRELERALIERRVDLVVHSYKDLPSASPQGLVIAAVPERIDPADRLLALPSAIDERASGPLPLVAGAKVGTASARRQALVKDVRPDLEVGLLRGNVPTRVAKLRAHEHDAILLAAAGLDRLARTDEVNLEGLVQRRLDPALFVPAPSQGALALQVRSGTEYAGDVAIHEAVASLADREVSRLVQVERELLSRVEGGCHVPFGAWCRTGEGSQLVLDAVFGLPDGSLRRASGQGEDPQALVGQVAESLLAPAASSKREPR